MINRKFNKSIKRILTYAVLILIAAAAIVPFIWMLSSSLKANKDVFHISCSMDSKRV
jgi:multiple sugar transport system permease protein